VRLQQRDQTYNTAAANLVDVVDAVGDMLKAVHEAIKAFLADPLKHLFTLLGTPTSRLKLIGRLL